MVSFQPRTSGTVHEFTCQLSRVISFTTLNAFVSNKKHNKSERCRLQKSPKRFRKRRNRLRNFEACKHATHYQIDAKNE